MKPNQNQPKRLEISSADLAKIEARKARDEQFHIDEDQLKLAEFGLFYGYDGIRAVLNNEISGDTMTYLLLAARKLDHLRIYNQSRASFVGAISAKQKRPNITFKKLTKDMIKEAKADT